MTMPSSTGMRIAFQDAPVHKGPGVALVGIADDILELTRRLAGRIPTSEPGGETGAAPAPQARRFDLER